MCIKIKKSGYRLDYEPAAKVYEPSPSTTEEQLKQRKRTSIGTIQNMVTHWRYFIPPRDWYSSFIFTSHKALAMFSPFFLLMIPILYIFAWDINAIITHLILTLLIFFLLLALLLSLKSRLINHERSGISAPASSLTNIIYYVLLNEYLILLAWADFIFKRYTVLWEKAESARET